MVHSEGLHLDLETDTQLRQTQTKPGLQREMVAQIPNKHTNTEVERDQSTSQVDVTDTVYQQSRKSPISTHCPRFKATLRAQGQ